MPLPADLIISAAAIDCYRFCARRFKQRYIDGIPLPDPDLEQQEAIDRGSLFHRLAVWDDLGLPLDDQLGNAADPQLDAYWDAYQTDIAPQLERHDAIVEHERLLGVQIDGRRIIARVDLLIVRPGGEVTIMDWKTGKPRHESDLMNSPQTRIYPLVAWEHFRDRSEGSIDPEQIQMIYWFPEDPARSVTFQYSEAQAQSDHAWLASRIREIDSDDDFPMTSDPRRCGQCGYAPHCGVIPQDGGTNTPEDPDDIPAAEPLWLANERL